MTTRTFGRHGVFLCLLVCAGLAAATLAAGQVKGRIMRGMTATRAVTVTTPKLTITGAPPPAPKPPFPGVTVATTRLTITGGLPPAPKPPFPGVAVTTQKLTITGK